MRAFSKIAKTTAALGALTLALTGCGAGEDSASGGKGEIDIAVFSGWEESIATSELWRNILEKKGYDVNLEYADAAPAFSGLSTGDYDFTTDVWLPKTHASYIEEYGDSLEKLGTWYDEAKLTIAVNADADIESLTELSEKSEMFNNRLIGIEPGAGLTKTTQEDVIPAYNLQEMEYVTSSTPAMLQELKTALENDENIVVTLWRPHWAYSAFDIKDLKDPKDALGGTETISSYGREGFSKDFPQVAEWLGDFKMSADRLADLENEVFNIGKGEDEDDYSKLVDQWVEKNQDWVDSLTEEDSDEQKSSDQPSGASDQPSAKEEDTKSSS